MSRPPVKAQQLAVKLAERVEGGEWATGTWLPSERQLADEYGTARGTVRAALETLIEAGTVDAVAGAGVRVASKPHSHRQVTLDAGAVDEQLRAIRNELGAINSRLRNLEKDRET
jgi:GntR family transcriptional regulator / MocR family aminotransferase